MNKTMTVKDAELRLEQMKNGKIPPKEVPTLANPMYAKAYDGFMKHGTTCNTLREGSRIFPDHGRLPNSPWG